jgi:hypothetical protein
VYCQCASCYDTYELWVCLAQGCLSAASSALLVETSGRGWLAAMWSVQLPMHAAVSKGCRL